MYGILSGSCVLILPFSCKHSLFIFNINTQINMKREDLTVSLNPSKI